MSSHDYYGGAGQQDYGYGQQGYNAAPPPQDQYGGHSPYPPQQGAYPPPQQPHDQYNQYNNNQYQSPPPQPHAQYDPYSSGNQYSQAPPHSGSYSPAPGYNNAVAPAPYQTDEYNRGSHSPYPPPAPYGGAPPPAHGEYGYGQQQYPQQHQQGAYGNEHARQYDAAGQPLPGPDGDRGLGATVLGSAGGAFLGHKMGGGALGTIGGMVAGAIGANVLENHHEKDKKKKKKSKHKKHGSGDHGSHYGGSSAAIGGLYPPSHGKKHKHKSRSKSRGGSSSSSSSSSDSD